MPSPRRTTVLIVEDDRALRDLYQAALAAAGYTALAVEDGTDALRRIDAGIPNVVVLDLALPRLSGVDVYRELKSHPETCDIPIVLVTGSDLGPLKEDDFACVLRKPVHPEVLVYEIENCVKAARLSRL